MSSNTQLRHCIVILGDQLSLSLSSLEDFDPKKDCILMMEVLEETTYVAHHQLKLTFVLSAMRHFATELKKKRYPIHYIELTDRHNKNNFTDNLLEFTKKHQPQKIIITEPGEYRVLKMMQSWQKQTGIPVAIRDDTRFYCALSEFADWAKGKKQLRMEFFYREMRKKTGILMHHNKPIGGQWNFDADNRKPANKQLTFPTIPSIKPDTTTKTVMTLVKKKFNQHIGDANDFNMAVTREQALKLLTFFCKYSLSEFGTYQDAMLREEYSLFHSQLSAYINIGLLLPQEVIEQAIATYQNNKIALHNIEGFIRQILGWREYIRGIYWLQMPQYKKKNVLTHKNPLPDCYWTADTDMACLKHAIQQTIDTAASHHIQRLMITGNFALLMQTLPEAVCDWYLAVYADAYEWVELPNTLGMSQFADGGIVASKPYISSGSYIHKMSNFCEQCRYNVKHKTEDDACPFNFLYWDFLIRHQKTFKSNPRMAFAMKHLDKMTESQRKVYHNKATQFRNKMLKK